MNKMLGGLKKLIQSINVKGNPLVNEDSYGAYMLSGQSQLSNSPVDYDTLFEYALSSPEVIIPVHTIISDIISDGFKIIPYDEGSGRNKVKSAEEWLRRNHFKSAIMQPLLWDAMITGDFYLYTPQVSEDKLNEKITSIVERMNVFDSKRMKNKIYREFLMDYSFGTLELVPLPSSTIEIVHDKHQQIIEYKQTVSGNTEKFTPEEIIHEKFITLNGKVYGFTPMKSILSELSIISGLKDIVGYGLEKGGVPEFIFALEDESPRSPSYRNLAHQLRRWKYTANKMRSMVLTGKIKIEKLTQNPKDMMSVELIDSMSKIVMMVWGVPPSKMGMSSGKEKTVDSGLATDGYYKKISNLQDWIYESVNWQLMIPKFGVQLIPNKKYMQDEVRETQVLMQKVQAGLQMWQNGWINEKYITEKLLDIDYKYIGDFKTKEIDNSGLLQNSLKNKEAMNTQGEEEVDNNRSQRQKENSSELDD